MRWLIVPFCFNIYEEGHISKGVIWSCIEMQKEKILEKTALIKVFEI